MNNNAEKIINRGFVFYSDFGAAGDGFSDDFEAIYAAHEFANEHRLPVVAGEGKTFLVHAFDRPAIIKTDTDFTGAKVIIDDRGSEVFAYHKTPLFLVERDAEPEVYTEERIGELFPNAEIHEGASEISWLVGVLKTKSLIRFTNAYHHDFVRFGSNVNHGNPRTDCLLVDTDGTIDPSTPVAFGFDAVTKIEIFRTDDKPITIKGGYFETICCTVVKETEFQNKWIGYARSFKIQRTNTTVRDITHHVVGEPYIPDTGYGRSPDGKLRQSYPYYGFLYFYNTYNSRGINLALNAHTTYYEDKKTSSTPVPMGSYDLVIEYSSHVSCEGITNGVDICDKRYWGIMSSNGAKNIELKNCSMSRFDAHRGFWNARLIGCEFGLHINVIGGGTLEVIDTRRKAGSGFIELRGDYGASFKGDIIIRNCHHDGLKHYRGGFKGEMLESASVIRSGFNASGKEGYLDWNFGYPCYLPKNITIENLTFDEPLSFTVYNSMPDAFFDEKNKNAYRVTESIKYKNMTPLKISTNDDDTVLNSITVMNDEEVTG